MTERAQNSTMRKNTLSDHDVIELLLLLLRQYRLQAELIDDFGATLHGLRELVVGDDVGLNKKLEALEAEAKAVTSAPKRLTLAQLDDKVRILESLRPPRSVN
jgi:hypothetical protein